MKRSWQKLAVVGITAVLAGIAFMQGPQIGDNAVSSLQNPTQITAQSQQESPEVVKQRLMDTVDYMSAVNTRSLENEKIEIAYELYKTENTLTAGGGANAGAYDNYCDVTIGVNQHTSSLDGFTESQMKDTFSSVVNYDAAEKLMLNEFGIEHETAHCGFFILENPFQVKDNPELSSALNATYADTALRSSFKTTLEDSFNGKVTHHGLADALNESYADAFGAIMLLKKYEGSEQVQTFLGKVSAERALTESISTRVGDDLINAYDMDGAIKSVLKEENLKKISEMDNLAEFKQMALEIANANLMNTLAKKTDAQLDTALGSWTIEKSINTQVYASPNTLKDGSMGTELLKEAYSKVSQSEIDAHAKNMEILNWQRDHSVETIKQADKEAKAFAEKVTSDIQVDGTKVQETINLLKEHTSKIRAEGGGQNKTLDQVLNEEAPALGLSRTSLKEAREAFKDLKEAQPEGPTFSKIKFG